MNKYNKLIAELRAAQALYELHADVQKYLRVKASADAIEEIQSSIFVCPVCAKDFTLTGPTEK